ncbi:tyrosine-type recombinase/integrase [Lysinibacillus fusiformis]|nr:tyrosine-type recombinase/integrase [Lysinibacillus fusiformis]WRS96261.1 tyrosine-type recombinase/integrase [Lysinibacillus fusiformis]
MQKIEEQVGIDAEIKRYLHPHRFRHTFATEFLTKGANLSFISDE